MNGYLELNEYLEYFKNQNFDLTKLVVIAIPLIANITKNQVPKKICNTNGNGKIDEEEFMNHIMDVLHHVRLHRKLTTSSTKILLTKKLNK